MSIQEFVAPHSLSEAKGLLSDGAIASVLAGGTDLLVGVRLGTRSPERVVDLKQIPELTAIHVDSESVQIGAAASAFSILHNSDVPSCFPGLAEALDLIGSTQIQGRCSAGGNLCNASPAADSIPALIANGAQCLITGPAGDHQMSVEDFVVGPSKNALKEGELLVALILPRPSPQTADAYLRLTPRTEMDIAVAGVGVPDGGDPISIRRCGEPIGDGGPDNASARRRQPGIVDSSLAGDKQDDTIAPADGGIQPSV